MKHFILFITLLSLAACAPEKTNSPKIQCVTERIGDVSLTTATLIGSAESLDEPIEASLWFMMGTDSSTVLSSGSKITVGKEI